MYNPTAYWQTQNIDLTASSLSRYFAISTNNSVTYSFDGTTRFTTTPSGSNPFVGQGTITSSYLEVVQDLSSQQSYKQPAKGTFNILMGPILAGQPFFASATGSGLNNYQYDSLGEAWYMDVSYVGGEAFPGGNCTDLGTYYFYYVNEDGVIINDTLTYGQTKRIISQTSAFYFMNDAPVNINVPNWITWTYVSRYPGNVTVYPYRDKLADYTLTVKRVTGKNQTTCATIDYAYADYTYIPENNLGLNSLSGAWSASNTEVTVLDTQFFVKSYSIPLQVSEDRGGSGEVQVSFPSLWCTVQPPFAPPPSGSFPISSSLVIWSDTTSLTGSYWYDLSGKGNHGLISGSTLTLSGSLGYGFNGTNNYVTYPITLNGQPSSSYTVQYYGSIPSESLNRDFFVKQVYSNGWDMLYDGASSPDRFVFRDVAAADKRANITPTLATKQLITITVNADTDLMELYLNDTFVTNFTAGGVNNFNVATQPLVFGFNTDGDATYWKGAVSDLLLFNKVLSATEVSQSYSYLINN